MSERIRPRDVARITSLSLRKVQEMAAAGKLPALKLGGVWTFEERDIRAWIKQEEQRQWRAKPPPISTGGATYGGDVLRLPDASIDEAYAQLMPRKRGSGSRAGARS
jgi:excisionase family DNA binding protein